jgi:hypothetical protein
VVNISSPFLQKLRRKEEEPPVFPPKTAEFLKKTGKFGKTGRIPPRIVKFRPPIPPNFVI